MARPRKEITKAKRRKDPEIASERAREWFRKNKRMASARMKAYIREQSFKDRLVRFGLEYDELSKNFRTEFNEALFVDRDTYIRTRIQQTSMRKTKRSDSLELNSEEYQLLLNERQRLISEYREARKAASIERRQKLTEINNRLSQEMEDMSMDLTARYTAYAKADLMRRRRLLASRRNEIAANYKETGNVDDWNVEAVFDGVPELDAINLGKKVRTKRLKD